jgi:hypothetical protein
MAQLREAMAKAMAARGINQSNVQASIMSSNPALNTQPHVPRGGKTYY